MVSMLYGVFNVNIFDSITTVEDVDMTIVIPDNYAGSQLAKKTLPRHYYKGSPLYPIFRIDDDDFHAELDWKTAFEDQDELLIYDFSTSGYKKIIKQDFRIKTTIKAAGDADYTITDTDEFDMVTVAPTTARTIILPTLADNLARQITIFNLNGTDIVIVDGEGADRINGGMDEVLVSANDFITVIGTSGMWAVIASKQSYETAWINRSDWTNVHPGSDNTKNADSNVTHNLDAPLSELIVRFLISTDGTDNNSFEVLSSLRFDTGVLVRLGIQVDQVDSDNILIQTGVEGIGSLTTAGAHLTIGTQNWYYKIVVQRR